MVAKHTRSHLTQEERRASGLTRAILARHLDTCDNGSSSGLRVQGQQQTSEQTTSSEKRPAWALLCASLTAMTTWPRRLSLNKVLVTSTFTSSVLTSAHKDATKNRRQEKVKKDLRRVRTQWNVFIVLVSKVAPYFFGYHGRIFELDSAEPFTGRTR